jgi:nucleotide-binding universal stress UspA family protein
MNSIHPFPPRKILAPTDLSTPSGSALQYARYFHERFGSAIQLLHAHHFELPPYFSSGQLGAIKHELMRLGKAATEYVRKESLPLLGHPAEIRVVDKAPVEAILEASREKGMDLIIMGMHGRRGVERVWLGSVTERVIRHSSLPVLCVQHPPAGTPIQHILCPMNTSETARAALAYAAEISKTMSAQLTVLHVVENGDGPLTCPLVGDDIRNSCKVAEVRIQGNAARTIADASAKLSPDLIVMGAERKSTLLGEFFSSTTASVMQLAARPLLVVPKIIQESVHK